MAKKILIVEDDMGSQLIIQRLIQRIGTETTNCR